MNTQKTDSQCALTMKDMNTFIDGELPGAVSSAVTEHLNTCDACAREFAARKQLRSRLKSAVAAQQPSPYLGTRVRANLHLQPPKVSWLQRNRLAGICAAMLLVLIGGGIAYQVAHLRWSVASQNAYIASLLKNVAHIMGPGLSGHVHCSVFRKYKNNPPRIETLHEEIGPEYKPLVDAVAAKMPREYRVYIAHECGYGERGFMHIGLKSDSKLLSVIVARKEPGENMRNSNLLPVLSGGGLDIYGASAHPFRIAAFETGDHLAYVLSDDSEEQVRQLLVALAPDIQRIVRGHKA
jgi:hypothetical protein